MAANGVGRHAAQAHQIIGGLLDGIGAVGHLHQQQRHQVDARRLQGFFNLQMAQPALAQHGAAQVGDGGHGRTQAVHHGFNVFFIQPGVDHRIAADGKSLLRAVARVRQKLIQTLVFGGGRGHEQVIGAQPVGKFAKFGVLVHADMGLVHHQPHL